LQFLLASRQSTPSAAATRTDQRHRHSQTLAAADPRHGGRIDRARVDLERSAAVSRAAMAAAAGGVSGGECGDREEERLTCALSQGQRPPPGLGNPMCEVMTVRLTSGGRLPTGPAELAAGLRYTTRQPLRSSGHAV